MLIHFWDLHSPTHITGGWHPRTTNWTIKEQHIDFINEVIPLPMVPLSMFLVNIFVCRTPDWLPALPLSLPGLLHRGLQETNTRSNLGTLAFLKKKIHVMIFENFLVTKLMLEDLLPFMSPKLSDLVLLEPKQLPEFQLPLTYWTIRSEWDFYHSMWRVCWYMVCGKVIYFLDENRKIPLKVDLNLKNEDFLSYKEPIEMLIVPKQYLKDICCFT